MAGRNVIIGVIVGSMIGIVAAAAFGPDGWVLGGGAAGIIVGGRSPDLAAALLHGAGAGGITGLVFAIVFGLGTGIRLALAAGDPALLAWGLNPFLVIAIFYGLGCTVVASIIGGVAYTTRDIPIT